jgi:hypothetical protein
MAGFWCANKSAQSLSRGEANNLLFETRKLFVSDARDQAGSPQHPTAQKAGDQSQDGESAPPAVTPAWLARAAEVIDQQVPPLADAVCRRIDNRPLPLPGLMPAYWHWPISGNRRAFSLKASRE